MDIRILLLFSLIELMSCSSEYDIPQSYNIMTRPYTPPLGIGSEYPYYLPPNRRYPVPPLPPPPPPPLPYDCAGVSALNPYDAILLASLQQPDLVPRDYPLSFYPNYPMPKDEPPCSGEPKSCCKAPPSPTTPMTCDNQEPEAVYRSNGKDS